MVRLVDADEMGPVPVLLWNDNGCRGGAVSRPFSRHSTLLSLLMTTPAWHSAVMTVAPHIFHIAALKTHTRRQLTTTTDR